MNENKCLEFIASLLSYQTISASQQRKHLKPGNMVPGNEGNAVTSISLIRIGVKINTVFHHPCPNWISYPLHYQEEWAVLCVNGCPLQCLVIRKICSKLDKGRLVSPEWKFLMELKVSFTISTHNRTFLSYLISLVLKDHSSG